MQCRFQEPAGRIRDIHMAKSDFSKHRLHFLSENLLSSFTHLTLYYQMTVMKIDKDY